MKLSSISLIAATLAAIGVSAIRLYPCALEQFNSFECGLDVTPHEFESGVVILARDKDANPPLPHQQEFDKAATVAGGAVKYNQMASDAAHAAYGLSGGTEPELAIASAQHVGERDRFEKLYNDYKNAAASTQVDQVLLAAIRDDKRQARRSIRISKETINISKKAGITGV